MTLNKFAYKKIDGLDLNNGFYPYSFINEDFVCLRIRFVKLTVFVKLKNKVDVFSIYLQNVPDLDELGSPPIRELHKDFVISCSNHKKR